MIDRPEHSPESRLPSIALVPETFVLQPMQLTDIPAVEKIERDIFPAPWPSNAYTLELTRNHYAHYFVLNRGSTIIGYAGMWVLSNEAHITTIGVDAQHQHQGIGKQLFLAIVGKAYEYNAQCLTLEVRPSNLPALRLYRHCGLTSVGRRRGYYNDNNEDAIIMWSGALQAPSFRRPFRTALSTIHVAGVNDLPVEASAQ